MPLSALDRKLLRDLRHIWTQALAIALVIAAGVSTLVLATGAYQSLAETRSAYYERYRFAHVFASAKRVPLHVGRQIAEIPGVSAVQTRVFSGAILDIEGMVEPATGQVISLPEAGPPLLNGLHVREGRLPEASSPDEVVVNEAFANAHGFSPGDTFAANLRGHKRSLRIVGIALSPEFIYALGPGDMMPDDRRFGVLWMSRSAAAAAYDLEGAFNAVALRLRRDARTEEVLDQLDNLLEPYGGRGAFSRDDQVSHAFLDSELTQLQTMSFVIPPIFLAVAAFLINITLSRLIAMEREQIGLLKALGYARVAIAAHYLKFVSIIAMVGIVIGFGAGVWMGRGLTQLYADFFHFPFLVFLNRPETFVLSGGVSLAAALTGALRSVWGAVSLAPAVAMSPPAPARYRHLWYERFGLQRYLPQASMMVLRHMLRNPLRALFTSMGVAASCGLLVMSLSGDDSINHMIDVNYFQSHRQDATVSFSEIQPLRVAEDLRHLPGVLRVEPYREVAATLRNGHLEKRIAVQGMQPDSDLAQLIDGDLIPVAVPEVGIALTEALANQIDASLGSLVRIETMEARRRTFEVPVTAILKSYLGLGAYMHFDVLNDLLGDGRVVSAADLMVDERRIPALYSKLKETPVIAGIMLLRQSLKGFRETLAENIMIMMTVYVVMASIITFGVVYNSARIQLSERGRELASLRVLGFTRREVFHILLGEVAAITILAIPLGWLMGYGFTWYLYESMASDLYRIPLVVERATFAAAGLIVIVAAAVSVLVVRRRVNRLDMIAVLKTRE